MTDVNAKVAASEERIGIRQAEYRTDIARLAEAMGRRDAESTRRDTWILLAMAGMFGLALTLLGVLIAVL